MSETPANTPAPDNPAMPFIVRVERLAKEISELKEATKEVFNEAKAAGLDVLILKMAIARRAGDDAAQLETEALLRAYLGKTA